MRVKIVLTGTGYAQTANIPCDGGDTVAQLKEKIKKRITGVPDALDLIFDGGKLFDEDTLNDLGIKEGDSIHEDNGNAGQAPAPTAHIDLTVGDLNLNPASSNNNNNDPASSSSSATTSSPAAPSSSTPPTQDEPATGTILVNPVRPLDEVLVVVFDISASMDATFVDTLSRLSSSKVCFGAFIDKTLAYEYSHAIGLICFGQNIYEKLPVTRQLGQFESVFGDVIKTEGATYLYPAVDLAVQKINAYLKELSDLPKGLKKRIMAFTDGGDNSGWSAYKVAQSVLEHSIVVDAVIVGGNDSDHQNLRALAGCSGGLSIRIPQQEASLSSVFEQEQILALSARAPRAALAKEKLTPETFKAYGDLLMYPYVGVDLKEVQAQPVTKPTIVSKAVTVDNAASMANKSGGNAASRRILKEYQDILLNGPTGTEAYMTDNDVYSWKIFLHGPPNTSYEGGIWVLDVNFPASYPFQPPKVVFLTPIYHCNISDQGRVCLDILKDQWSPALTISKVAHSLRALLTDPNPDDALVAWKAALARTDRAEYERQIVAHTKQHATQSPDALRQLFNLSL